MKLLKIYLDTSVINFLFAEDAPDFKRVTIDFFEHYVRRKVYQVYVSEVVILEIEQTSDENQKERLLNVIAEFDLRVLPLTDEANKLALLYLAERILPEKKLDDARHIALTTVNQIDILLSWNFKHLANINKQLAVKVINEREGYYYPMLLTNPMEVLYEDD
ncbi:MAG: type II toxin-antitoxin system VapC family toxin [Deltaproteobacteria bacterium]